MQVDGADASQGMECGNCGGEWEDLYTLSGLSVEEEPKGSLKTPAEKGYPLAKTASMSRTAGEVRFIKDRSGDAGEWAFGSPGPSERDIQEDFVFNARHLKPLAQTIRSCLMALGHVTSAYNRFVKIKSRNISPDGSLGGKGYIQKITDMRRQLMNCVEALSALTDTIYDEMSAPHWNPSEDTLDPRDREEVREIIEDAEDIKDDPEAWASGQEEEMDAENEDSMGKVASRRVMRRYANRRLA